MRLVLLILLSEALHTIWILEQPSGSTDVLPFHSRFNWIINEVLYVPKLIKLYTFHVNKQNPAYHMLNNPSVRIRGDA